MWWACAMADLQCFGFDDHLVRVIDRDGQPWFVAIDICRAIGVRDASEAVEKLDDDEKAPDSIRTLGGEQSSWVVSESGLYTLILRSRAATTPGSPAHRFRKWVTAEVLPAIRKTGSYVAPAPDDGNTLPVTVAEDRIKLDKLHYAIRCFGPAVGRDLWLQLGLDYVPSMAMAKPHAKPIELTLATFAEERLLRRPNVMTTATVIYNAYKDWAQESGQFVMSESGFGKAMSRMGFDKTKSNRIYYRGVTLKPAEMTVEG
jgi:prophage antirepressor-like protein